MLLIMIMMKTVEMLMTMMMMRMPKQTRARIHPGIPVSVSADRPARVNLVKIATNNALYDDGDDKIMGGVVQGLQYQDN